MLHVVLFCFLAIASCEGYYWREWNGSIPADAFTAGIDSRGDTYIAQVFVPGTGVYVGQIFSGQQEIFVSTVVFANKTVNKSDYDLKILCTDGDDLHWMVGNIHRTREVLKAEAVRLVKGGVTNAKNPIYIGKYINNDNVFVGSVHGDWLADNVREYWLYYSNLLPVSGVSTYYEILTTR